ncbi:MAG: hypothetical protein JRF63_02410 [Deltaproteobacteria bacterium]|nr:hypothetical protein [Deltaproteobacteria bacterium]
MNRMWIVMAAVMVALACDDEGGGDQPQEDAGPQTEAVCDDGADDDSDGDVDCDDPDCALVAASEGACINPDDMEIYAGFDANAEWNKCVPGAPYGLGCFTDVECNTQCVHDNTGISLECSGCFAELVACFIGNCATECAQQPPTEECNECVTANCGPPYTECFGELVCEYEYGCLDTMDNDGDELVDSEDPDCQ